MFRARKVDGRPSIFQLGKLTAMSAKTCDVCQDKHAALLLRTEIPDVGPVLFQLDIPSADDGTGGLRSLAQAMLNHAEELAEGEIEVLDNIDNEDLN